MPARLAQRIRLRARALGQQFAATPWPVASALALGAAAAADVVLEQKTPCPPEFVAILAAFVLVLGLLHGACWSLAWRLARVLGARFAPLLWPALGLAAGVWLAHELGALVRLQTQYGRLALGVLVASAGGGLLLGLVCAGFQPTARWRSGFWLARAAGTRRAIALVLLAAAAVLFHADRTLYVDQYERAHHAQRFASVALSMFAVVVAGPGQWLARASGSAWLLACAAFAACLFTGHEARGSVLYAFGARPLASDLLQVSRSLVDWDRDGYASLLAGGDCAPLDPRVHPGAREIPGNGIDDNCLLGDGAVAQAKPEPLGVPRAPSPLDVVVITVDALRWDHLGVYNRRYLEGGRGTSPNLDRWAKRATIFERAYTPGSWTSLAIPALMRGVYPRRLHWKRYFETDRFAILRKPFEGKLGAGEQPLRMFPLAFDDPRPPLASILARRGMHTAAIIDDGFSEMLQADTGAALGFTVVRDVDLQRSSRRNDAGTADFAIATLSHGPRDKRMFMWVHFFGPHWPDEEHEGVRKYGTSLPDRYDHEIAFFDQQLERLLQAIAARGQPTAVFLTADHGEVLTHGVRQHGQSLEEGTIRVPLIAQVPGWPAARVTHLSGTIDLVPTILALTGTPRPSYLDGIDLAALLRAGPAQPRVLLSDTWRFDGDGRIALDLVAAYDGTRKAVLDRLSGVLYGFEQDRDRPLPRGSGAGSEALTRAIHAYLEDTGGTLRLSD